MAGYLRGHGIALSASNPCLESTQIDAVFLVVLHMPADPIRFDQTIESFGRPCVQRTVQLGDTIAHPGLSAGQSRSGLRGS
jgi:hypothetical protein